MIDARPIAMIGQPLRSKEDDRLLRGRGRFSGDVSFELEVDPETGTVQTHGGIVQGVGQALAEACVVDGASGQTLTGSLLDNALPRAAEVPSFPTLLDEAIRAPKQRGRARAARPSPGRQAARRTAARQE